MKILMLERTGGSLARIAEIARRQHEVVTRSVDDAYVPLLLNGIDMVFIDASTAAENGFSAMNRLREAVAPRWLPVALIARPADRDLHAPAIEAGADGFYFLSTPSTLFEARLGYFARLVEIQTLAIDRAERLVRMSDEQARDQEVAQSLLGRLVNSEKLKDPALQVCVLPAAGFSGDVVAAARTPAGVLHVLLADGTGHGLAAALNVLPVVAPFYRMTARGFNIETIVAEMNQKVRELLPVDRFVAASLVSVDARGRMLKIWQGGMPTPILVRRGIARSRALAHRHLALGILDDDAFSGRSEAIELQPGDELLLFSDGAIEIEDPNGNPLGLDGLLTALRGAAPGKAFDNVFSTVVNHRQLLDPLDDISLVMIDCDVQADASLAGKSACPSAALQSQRMPHGWRFSLRLGPEELKRVDAVPLLLHLAQQFQGGTQEQGKLFVLLSELFNNALDHGVLRLDSRLKASPDGLDRYFSDRSERLAALEDGFIEFVLETSESDGAGVLRLICRDSGEGFDHRSMLSSRSEMAEPDEYRPYGRGISLVRQMADSVIYRGNGNEVEVRLRLGLADNESPELAQLEAALTHPA